MRKLALLLVVLLPSFAFAKATPEEAARLGKDLTPVGAGRTDTSSS